MKKAIQRSVQVASLLFFILLIFKGRVQLWMLIFASSTLLTLLFSRFYCGWICPINTVIRPISWVKRRLRVKRQKMPTWIEGDIPRNIVLVLFLATMAFVFKTGKKLPILPEIGRAHV